jgi:hypothetical protein
MNILGNSKIRITGQYYWLSSSRFFNNNAAFCRGVNPDGTMNNFYVYYDGGVRPAISLTPGIKYTEGDGSKEHPYIIKTN